MPIFSSAAIGVLADAPMESTLGLPSTVLPPGFRSTGPTKPCRLAAVPLALTIIELMPVKLRDGGRPVPGQLTRTCRPVAQSTPGFPGTFWANRPDPLVTVSPADPIGALKQTLGRLE